MLSLPSLFDTDLLGKILIQVNSERFRYLF